MTGALGRISQNWDVQLGAASDDCGSMEGIRDHRCMPTGGKERGVHQLLLGTAQGIRRKNVRFGLRAQDAERTYIQEDCNLLRTDDTLFKMHDGISSSDTASTRMEIHCVLAS